MENPFNQSELSTLLQFAESDDVNEGPMPSHEMVGFSNIPINIIEKG